MITRLVGGALAVLVAAQWAVFILIVLASAALGWFGE